MYNIHHQAYTEAHHLFDVIHMLKNPTRKGDLRMKYKDRKHAKRKYKQALLATVATMTLGLSVVGGTTPVFADKYADMGKAVTSIAGKITDTKAQKKMATLTGGGVQTIYKGLETGKLDEIPRDALLAVTAAVPYGGAIISLILGAVIPTETSSLADKLKIVEENAKKHTINLLSQHLITLQNKLEQFQENVNPGGNAGTYYSTSPSDAHGLDARTINEDFLSLINECQTEGLEKELLPVYTAATSAHLLFLEFLEKNKDHNPNLSIDPKLYKETFVDDKRMKDLRKTYITYMKKTYDLHIEELKEILQGTSVEYDKNPNTVFEKLEEREQQLRAIVNAAPTNQTKRGELDTLTKARTSYQKALAYDTKTIYNAAFAQIANWHWVKDINDNWYYYDDDNNQKTGWVKDDYSGSWYYFNPEPNKQNSKNESFTKGQMMTGWVQDGERWFYLSPDNGTKNSNNQSFAKGAAMTGWVQDGERWFYLSPDNGTQNSAKESFVEGQMMTGWIDPDSNQKWFYLSPDNGTQNSAKESFAKGQMMTGIVDFPDKRTFYFSPKNGTQNSEKESFAKGQMVTGWIDFGNETWHYFSTYKERLQLSNGGQLLQGQMVKGTDLSLHAHEKTNDQDGPMKTYTFDKDGVWKK